MLGRARNICQAAIRMPDETREQSSLNMSKTQNGDAVTEHIGSALAFTLAGFALLTVGDSIIKSAAGLWPSTAVAALRFVIGAAGLAVILLIRQGSAGFSVPLPWHQAARGLSMAVATTAFFTSIFLMPLADATAIVFVSPALTSLISARLLGEKTPIHIWVSIGVSLLGVALILRPNLADLGPVALLPLVAALGMSCVMLLNRKVSGHGSVLLMQFLLALFAAPILIVVTIIGHATAIPDLQVNWPPLYVVLICLLVAFSASVSHMLIYLGTVKASAATVAPMTYVQLLVALIVGSIFYDNFPDLQSIAGATLIVASGLYLWRKGGTSR